MTWTRVAAPMAVLAIASAVTLGGVAWNRSDTESTITLTERELSLPGFRPDDDSGLDLRLSHEEAMLWLDGGAIEDTDPDFWFNETKLRSIGFDCHVPANHPDASRFYARALRRAAFVVLELDGAAWQRRFERRVRQSGEPYRSQQLSQGPIANTRLAAIDAGPSAAALRARYPDGARYMILPAVVDIAMMTTQRGPRLYGSIREVIPGAIHVPREHRAVLDAILADHRLDGQPHPPRYEVRVRVGARLEPWVESVRRLP